MERWSYNLSYNFHDKCLAFLVNLSLPQMRDVHLPGINICLFYVYCWWILVLNVFHISSMIWGLYLNPDLPSLLLSFISPFSSIHCFYLIFLFGWIWVCFSLFFLAFITAVKMKNSFIVYIHNFFWNFLTLNWLITTRGYRNHSQ